MNLKTLINKASDSVRLILTQPTMMFRDKETMLLLNEEHVVDADESARPDLIALQYYGNQSMTDVILKWNGISDPFALNEGDILEIPAANVPFFKLDRPKEFEENPVKQQFVDGKRLSKKDQRRLDALKKKYGKENLLPPNVIPVGKKNYEYVGTKIVMGAQVQTDPVVDAINRDIDEGDLDITDFDTTAITIGGENIGAEFEKIPGGAWTWASTVWLPVNPDVAQEVAGSLYGEYGDPNGSIQGSFEGQLYFDKLRDGDDGNGTGDGNDTGDGNGTSGTSADETGDNQNDGGNPPGGNNSNNGTSGTGSTAPCGQ